MDAIAGYIQISYGVENLTTAEMWVFEALILPFGIVGFWGLWSFRKKFEMLSVSPTFSHNRL
jgi:hypothetical protein